MNATNRGILRGLSLSLAAVRDIVQGMSDAEQRKEIGGEGRPALDDRFIGTSADLEQAAMGIDFAIRIMQYIASEEADFEEWIEDAEVPNQPPDVDSFSELYE